MFFRQATNTDLDPDVLSECDHLLPVCLGLGRGLLGVPDGFHSRVVLADLRLSLQVDVVPEEKRMRKN